MFQRNSIFQRISYLQKLEVIVTIFILARVDFRHKVACFFNSSQVKSRTSDTDFLNFVKFSKKWFRYFYLYFLFRFEAIQSNTMRISIIFFFTGIWKTVNSNLVKTQFEFPGQCYGKILWNGSVPEFHT